MSLTIYHNPRCSKSRQALALIEEAGLTPNIVKYLETGVTVATLQGLMTALGLQDPKGMMRKGEKAFKALNLKEETNTKALLSAIANNPILLERPIIVKENRAVIGRPPENVEPLL